MNVNDLYSYTDRLVAFVVDAKHAEAAEQADRMIKFLRIVYRHHDALRNDGWQDWPPSEEAA